MPGLESLHLRPALYEGLVQRDAVEASQLLPAHLIYPHRWQRVPTAQTLFCVSAQGRAKSTLNHVQPPGAVRASSPGPQLGFLPL